MRPEDVPDDLVEKASEASWDSGETAFMEYLNEHHHDPDSESWERDRILWQDAREEDKAETRRDMRAALAAIIPDIQAQALRDEAETWSTAEDLENWSEAEIHDAILGNANRLIATTDEES